MIAVTMIRDEADIIERTLRHLLNQGVDRIVVADNLSADGSGDIARSLERVTVVVDNEPAYYQAEKMTALIAAHAREGEWVIPFDADEYWSGLHNLTDGYDVAATYPHVHIGAGCRLAGTEPLTKVAFRWRPGVTVAMGNHRVEGAGDAVATGLIDVCHHQYRTLGQTMRKVRQGTTAYKLTTMSDSTGSHWRDLAAKTDVELAEWWAEYVAQPTIECGLS